MLPQALAGCSRQKTGLTGKTTAAGRCEMDDKDHVLLAALRQDARRSLTALARDIGLSRSATQDRLHRLQTSGVLLGFTTVESPATGHGLCAHFLIRHQPGRTCAQILPRLRKIAGITLIHSVAGTIDLVLRAEAHDMPAIEAIRAAIADLPGIETVTTLMVLDRHLG
jgi:Lrp/AsnC family transcriptional regulator, leucine-responsive regulatory protein